MRTLGITLVLLGGLVLRHARHLSAGLVVRQRNLAHDEMTAAARARRRRR